MWLCSRFVLGAYAPSHPFLLGKRFNIAVVQPLKIPHFLPHGVFHHSGAYPNNQKADEAINSTR